MKPQPTMWNKRQRLQYFGIWTFLTMLIRRIVKGHWSEYIDLIGYTTGTGTAFAALTGSPYAPKVSGRLKKVLITVSRTANTSIAWAGEIQLKSPSFGGVDNIIPFRGIGEGAADIVDSAIPVQSVDLDVAVKTGVNITAEYRYLVTPTTPQLYVHGVFQG